MLGYGLAGRVGTVRHETTGVSEASFVPAGREAYPLKELRALVQRVTTELLDDLDESPAVETVRVGYAGREYEIDLSDKHVKELEHALERGCRAPRRGLPRMQLTSPKPPALPR